MTIFRSGSPWGPFEPYPRNPILTHRGVDGAFSPIQCTGHAELFEDAAGKWWIAALGVRKLPYAMLHNLGRETFLGAVSWDEDGWPVVNGCGQLRERIRLEAAEQGSDDFRDDFKEDTLKPDYCHVRNPHMKLYQIADGALTLTGGEGLSTTDASPTLLGVRQKQFRSEAVIRVRPEEGSLAGLTAYYNGEHHYALCASLQDGRMRIALRKRMYDMEVEAAQVEIPGGEAWLRILTDEHDYVFEYRTEDGDWVRLGVGAVAALCTEVTRTMTFTGTFLGLFCDRGRASFAAFSVRYP